jgi:hypothetical protein
MLQTSDLVVATATEAVTVAVSTATAANRGRFEPITYDDSDGVTLKGFAIVPNMSVENAVERLTTDDPIISVAVDQGTFRTAWWTLEKYDCVYAQPNICQNPPDCMNGQEYCGYNDEDCNSNKVVVSVYGLTVRCHTYGETNPADIHVTTHHQHGNNHKDICRFAPHHTNAPSK